MGKRRSTAASQRKTPRISDPEREAAIALGTKRPQGVIRARKALAPEEARTGANGLLVAEGDSWFDYPLYDVLQELDRRFNYRIESVSHKGDTVEEVVAGAPALKHVSYVDVRSALSNELAGRRYRRSWENGLHPTRAGFVRVAERFHKTISRLPMP